MLRGNCCPSQLKLIRAVQGAHPSLPPENRGISRMLASSLHGKTHARENCNHFVTKVNYQGNLQKSHMFSRNIRLRLPKEDLTGKFCHCNSAALPGLARTPGLLQGPAQKPPASTADTHGSARTADCSTEERVPMSPRLCSAFRAPRQVLVQAAICGYCWPVARCRHSS